MCCLLSSLHPQQPPYFYKGTRRIAYHNPPCSCSDNVLHKFFVDRCCANLHVLLVLESNDSALQVCASNTRLTFMLVAF